MNRDKRTILFKSTVNRNEIDLEVTVSATVYWSSGLDERGYESGFMAEDIEARQDGPSIELNNGEIELFKTQALEEYLNN